MIVLAEEPAEPVMVQVYNPLGQLVYVADHAAQRSIMVQPDPLATGSYVVHVQVGHRRFVAQLQRASSEPANTIQNHEPHAPPPPIRPVHHRRQREQPSRSTCMEE
ncbi:MAG: T9SS type A sorting domain-containing protein [Flavobacteriales bacterium]|nr:T9SS type A sorting domain-containing protein [Flavobacteriales bacterium]